MMTGKVIAHKLTERTGHEVQDIDFYEWMEPEGNGSYEKCDNAVRELMGSQLYREADIMARLPELMESLLNGDTLPITVSGYTFTA